MIVPLASGTKLNSFLMNCILLDSPSHSGLLNLLSHGVYLNASFSF